MATTSGVLGKGFVTGVQITVHSYTVSAPSTVSFAVGRSGSGTKRKLITGASVTTGAAFTETAFDDAATAGIASGAQPYTGRFKPEEALSAFNGAPVSSRYSFELSRTGSAPASLGPWGLRVLTAGCVDTDGDAVFDTSDNCEAAANVDQANYEFDALGDVCDDDDDDDGVADATDACPRGLRSFDPGGDATDYEGDGCRDTEDADDDNDGVPDAADGCPQAAKGPGGDTDGDGCKDFEDADDDNDGVMDSMDRCPLASDPAQTDTDADGTGDACDADDDGDGVIDGADAFPLDPSRSAPSAEPTPSPSPSATPVRSAPRITRLRLSRKRIAAGRRAKVRYTVSAAATTRFTVFSVKRCGKRKGCKPLTARRRFRRMNTAGAVTVVLRTKGLRTGRYRLRLIPSNTDGSGKAATVAFRVR